MKQAWRPDDPWTLDEAIAAVAYLIGLALPILVVIAAFALLVAGAQS